MRLPRRDRKRGRIDQYLRALPPQPERDLGETEVKADHHAELADWGVDGWDDGRAGFDAVAFFQNRTAGDVDVEEVEFLVAAGDGAMLVDPDQCVLDLLAALGGFVDAHVDWEAGGPRFMLEAENEGAGGHRLDERDCFRGGGGDVVGCFWEEECLGSQEAAVLVSDLGKG